MGTRVRRTVALAAVAACAAASAYAVPASASGGSFTHARYVEPHGHGAREYWLYVPSGLGSGAPLVVYLHGCNETAVQTAKASRFNVLADRNGFAVLYPQQNVTADSSAPAADGNGVGCWNWFLDADQHRGAGEPAVLAGMTRAVAAQLRSDRRRIYVEGVSAGADMAVILGAAYPDLYAAVAALAGCAYATCGDGSGALTNREMGRRARVVPLFVENGSADTVNNVAMATGLVESWLGADDLADDGTANGSVARTPARSRVIAADRVPHPGSGDVCVHENSATCPGGVVGFDRAYPTTVSTFTDSRGCDIAELWVLHGMQHAHPDAPGDGPYTDPLGPDVSRASYRFFSSHSLSGGCHR